MPETADRTDPFIAFRYKVTISGLSTGGFSEVTGLQLDTEMQDFMEGGLNTYVHKFQTRTKQSNIVLKRGIVDRVLWDWYWDIMQGKIIRLGGSIEMLEHDGVTTAMRWEFREAFPTKWIGPSLNSLQSNVAVETFELVHHGLELVD